MRLLQHALVTLLIATGSDYAEPVTNPSSAETSAFPPPLRFTHCAVALQNGSNIVKCIESGDSAKARHLIGKPVALYGGTAPPGGTADLVLDGGILLKIELDPPKDVRPHAAIWAAWVLGNVTGVDVKKKVIRIKAKPDDWQAMITM